MLFNSYIFLFSFLPLTLFFYYIVSQNWKNRVLSVASYCFYGYWNVDLCALLFISTGFNYFLGRKIHLAQSDSDRRNYLILNLILNLSLLAFFKYTNFFLENANHIFPKIPNLKLEIVLPLGISFITFHGMSFVLDIYRKKIIPVGDFWDFVCYFSMFPHLIAGPIVRFSQIAGQLIERHTNIDKVGQGVRFFIIGLASKVLLADSMAFVADNQLKFPNAGSWNIWIGITAFSLQIYFDFSGYSNMAIGLGKLVGFDLPENFNFPYQARGISDFWRRWHMTLSRWLRDYLYVPLGGSRCSRYRWSMNILITFLLCGLWHGAAWTYVIWGGYHGLCMILERPFRDKLLLWPAWLVVPLTNILVIIGWVFFRASSMDQAWEWLGKMFDFSFSFSSIMNFPPKMIFVGFLVLQLGCWTSKIKINRLILGTFLGDTCLVILLLSCIVAIQGVGASPFLYYQF